MDVSSISPIVLQVVALLITVVCHEVAHGYVAFRLGDPTAKSLKRLSFNPIRHIDPIGTLALPALLALAHAPIFGFAKPVPINPTYFRNPYQGMMWVALAGPLTNFSLASITYLALWGLLRVWPNGLYQIVETGAYTSVAEYVMFFLVVFFIINIILGTFNLIPLPPLDGSRILAYFVPNGGRLWLRKLERWGFLIVLGLLLLGVLQQILAPIYDWAIWALQQL